MDLDILDATDHYRDHRGYRYVAISDSWKRLCLDFPDSKRVQVPAIYRQQSLHTTIDGQEVVLQAWKGDCPQAYREMPGGIGGEVGIYHVDPDRRIPDLLNLPRIDDFPVALRDKAREVVSRILGTAVAAAQAGVDQWWPYPRLNAEIRMRLLHPNDGRVFFEADPTEPAGGYWMSRWMSYTSYARYLVSETFHGRKVPLMAHEYHMEFSVKGHRFLWAASSSQIVAI